MSVKNKVVVLSGGLDSSILTYKLVTEFGKDRVKALSFNYGQKHSLELGCAKTTCEKLGIEHRVIDISFIGDIIAPVSALSNRGLVSTPTIQDVIGDPQPPTYVPFRNMLMCSLAFTFAESSNADAIYLGLQVHDEYSYWDTSQYFIDAINNIASLNRTYPVKLEAPFAHMAKWEEIEIGKELKVPFKDTWTCYDPQYLPWQGPGNSVPSDYDAVACGVCPSCAERIMNFAKAGLADPVLYNGVIDWDKLIAGNRINV